MILRRVRLERVRIEPNPDPGAFELAGTKLLASSHSEGGYGLRELIDIRALLPKGPAHDDLFTVGLDLF